MPNPYNFKKSKRAQNTTIHDQIMEVNEKAADLRDAFIENPLDDIDILSATWDVILMAEGVLRKYSDDQVIKAKTSCINKNKKRGYM